MSPLCSLFYWVGTPIGSGAADVADGFPVVGRSTVHRSQLVLQARTDAGQEGQGLIHPGQVSLFNEILITLIPLRRVTNHGVAVVSNAVDDVVDEAGTIVQSVSVEQQP